MREVRPAVRAHRRRPARAGAAARGRRASPPTCTCRRPACSTGSCEDGARQFVFEGRECGGHVGPARQLRRCGRRRSSAAPRASTAARRAELHVLFAGGIHDERSAADGRGAGRAAGRAGRPGRRADGHRLPVHRRGRRRPAPSSPAFQRRGAGLRPTRCCSRPRPATPPAACATAVRRRLPRHEAAAAAPEGTAGEELWAELEQLNLGRLRHRQQGRCAATARRACVAVDEDEQRREGMFMIGQVADAARRGHHHRRAARARSAEGSARLARGTLPTRLQPRLAGERRRSRSDVAIVGMACVLPGAAGPGGVLGQHPRRRRRGHRGAGRALGLAAATTTRTRTAPDHDPVEVGRLPRPVPFDPLAYGIPPASLRRHRAGPAARPARSAAARWPTPATPIASRPRERTVGGLRRRGGGTRPGQRVRLPLGVCPTLRRGRAGRALDAAARVHRGLLPRRAGQRRRRPHRQPPRPRRRQLHRRRGLRLVAGRARRRRARSCGPAPATWCCAAAPTVHNGFNDYLLFASAHALSPTRPVPHLRRRRRRHRPRRGRRLRRAQAPGRRRARRRPRSTP